MSSFIPLAAVATSPCLHAGRVYEHVPLSRDERKAAQELKLKLHPAQAEVFRCRTRFRVVVAGRRQGKTHLVCVELYKAAEQGAGRKCWYVAPTYAMAKQIAWEKLKELVPAWRIAKIHEVELKITLVNGSQIVLKGADKPDSVRGVGVNFLVLDEFQDMKKELWTAIRPTLSDTKGRVIIIGTPKSFNQLYEMYQRGNLKNPHRNPQWTSFTYKTSDSPFIPRSEIADARREMDIKTFAQEYEASFVSSSGRVYYDFNREECLKPCHYDPGLRSAIGQDFNVDPMCSVIVQERGREVHVVGELHLRHSNTAEVCRELIAEYGLPLLSRATVFPDPAGNNRSSARGESDLAIFREHGFQSILFKAKAPLVRDRIAAVNALVMSAAGERRLFVDPSCRHLVEGLEQTVYKEGTPEVDKSMGVEHPTDALGYFCDFVHPVRKRMGIVGVEV